MKFQELLKLSAEKHLLFVMFVQCKNHRGPEKIFVYNSCDPPKTATESVTANYKHFEPQG